MTSPVPRQESTKILTVVLEELLFAWRVILCAFYICWWRSKHYLWYDPKLNRGAVIVGASSALLLLLDIVLFLFGKEAPTWLGRSAILILIPTALLLTVHRVAEVGKSKKEISFASHVEPLADALTDLVGMAPQERDNALTEFVAKLLKQIHEDFVKSKNISVTISVMPCQSDGKLRISYLFPLGTEYDPNVTFKPGEGGAGYSYQEVAVVYVPSIVYKHGIIISVPKVEAKSPKVTYGLKRRLYVPIAPEYELFESFMCLPVTSRKKTHGVINVDSKVRDAFDINDVHVLRAYARILGDGISLCA